MGSQDAPEFPLRLDKDEQDAWTSLHERLESLEFRNWDCPVSTTHRTARSLDCSAIHSIAPASQTTIAHVQPCPPQPLLVKPYQGPHFSTQRMTLTVRRLKGLMATTSHLIFSLHSVPTYVKEPELYRHCLIYGTDGWAHVRIFSRR